MNDVGCHLAPDTAKQTWDKATWGFEPSAAIASKHFETPYMLRYGLQTSWSDFNCVSNYYYDRVASETYTRKLYTKDDDFSCSPPFVPTRTWHVIWPRCHEPGVCICRVRRIMPYPLCTVKPDSSEPKRHVFGGFDFRNLLSSNDLWPGRSVEDSLHFAGLFFNFCYHTYTPRTPVFAFCFAFFPPFHHLSRICDHQYLLAALDPHPFAGVRVVPVRGVTKRKKNRLPFFMIKFKYL